MKNLAAVRDEVGDWQALRQRLTDSLELAELDDESLRPDLEREVAVIEAEIAHREFEAKLSGKYDKGNALLAIHAGRVFLLDSDGGRQILLAFAFIPIRETNPGAFADLVAAGLATQRSSIMCWDRVTGQALSPVIS